VKAKLFEMMQMDREFTKDDEERLNPTHQVTDPLPPQRTKKFVLAKQFNIYQVLGRSLQINCYRHIFL
jgi:hypothetical protein